jgi:DNA-binding LytR/AlgR family response regulator
MKIRIDIDPKTEETEVTIKCREIDGTIAGIQRAVAQAGGVDAGRLRLMKEGREYYLPPDDVLFFESVGGRAYAHTETEVFEARLRLYELEELLPRSFIRVSKSAILGTMKIYSIEKNPVGPSTVQFRGTHKQLSVSRQYFKLLQDRLNGGGE